MLIKGLQNLRYVSKCLFMKPQIIQWKWRTKMDKYPPMLRQVFNSIDTLWNVLLSLCIMSLSMVKSLQLSISVSERHVSIQTTLEGLEGLVDLNGGKVCLFCVFIKTTSRSLGSEANKYVHWFQQLGGSLVHCVQKRNSRPVTVISSDGICRTCTGKFM